MKHTRRSFLQLLLFGSLLSCKPAKHEPAVIVLGKAADFPEGATNLDLYRVRVVRHGAEFRAVSLVCTHQPCLLSAHAAGFDCPCHGSKFDASGAVITGPATKPLPWYDLSVTPGGELLLRK